MRRNPTRFAGIAALAALFGWVGVCLGAGAAAPAQLAGQIDAVVQKYHLERAFFGAKVVSLQTGEVLYARNSSSFFMPASNMKLVTATAAAEILGLDYRFQTLVATNGRINAGSLEGDLIVVGSGDPMIGARLVSPDLEDAEKGDPLATFRQWAEELKRRGIRRITGNLVGDPTVFGGPDRGSGWAWDDFAWGFAAPVSGLQFNENAVLVHIAAAAPGSLAPTIEMTPAGAINLVNRLTYAGKDDDPEVEATVLEPAAIELRGKTRADRASIYSLAVQTPPEYFLAELRQVLVESGIAVDGQDRVIQDTGLSPETSVTLLTVDSPDLRQVLKVLLKVSQNLYAETVLKTLSPRRIGKTFEDGRDQVRQFLRGIGVSEDEFVLADGSGMSRYNLLTPNLLVTLLEHTYRQSYGPALIECLPVAGVDGTLRQRMRASAAAGNTRAKTGTLAYVRCLSGYVKTKDGEMLVFSLMLNHAPAELVERPERALDEIVGLLADYGKSE